MNRSMERERRSADAKCIEMGQNKNAVHFIISERIGHFVYTLSCPASVFLAFSFEFRVPPLNALSA